MTSRPPGRHPRALAAALTLALIAGLPATAGAAGPGAPTPPGPAPDPRARVLGPGDEPSQAYLDTVAAEGRRFAFEPGGRVTVPFSPRADDRWPVDGGPPRALPAGRRSGAEMARAAGDPAATATPAAPPTAAPAPAPTPTASPQPTAASTPAPAASPAPAATPAPTPSPPAAPVPSASPTAAPDAAPGAGTDAPFEPSPIPAVGASAVVPAEPAALAPSAVGMRREVLGFLPYWEVADSTTRVNFDVVTHLAYFSVGVDASGNLRKRNADGSLTTGWAGWTSSKMTTLINAAHQKKSRVLLTITIFAWSSGGATTQKALLGSAAARLNLAKQAAAAVRDRGADGVNLDVEPLASGYEDEFVALVRTMRAELDRIAPGYHLSFDTLGYPGNYPLEGSLAAGGADAVFVMGYDYRTAGSGVAGSIDPLAGPTYDLADTVRAYRARVPAGKILLGIPYYGRAWSTKTDALNSETRANTDKYGTSVAVNYESAIQFAAKHGRRYDATEVSAWTAYQKETCTTTYGCVTSWRQIYYDDAATLKARYDLVNQAGLRGTGMWALGYDGTRTELYQALADKFLNDTTPPRAGIVALPAAARPDQAFEVRWTAADDWSGIASYDVQVAVGGGAWTAWLTGTKATSGLFLGTDGAGHAFRVRARDGKGNTSSWNVTSVYAATPTLAAGGFLRVTADTLNVRERPTTAATRLATAARNDVFAITGGPSTADGYTWHRVTGPLTTWGPVGDVFTNAWVATSSASVTNVVAVRAPNTALVAATIRQLGFGGAGAASLGTAAAAVEARSFSPNGDGSKDRLAVRWNNRVALGALELRVLRTDGTTLGTRALGTTAAGWQAFDWDGTVAGSAVADGRYLLQLVGSAAGTTYRWPAASPAVGDLPARTAVRVDRVAPVFEAAAISAARLSPNGDGKADAVTVTATAAADTARWEVLVAPLVGTKVGAPVRRIAGTGRSASASWNGTADDGKRVPDGTYRVTLRVLDGAGNAAARAWTATVDTAPPALAATATPASFSPNGDGAADTTRLAWSSSEPVTGRVTILRGTAKVRAWTISGTSGAIAWNGRDGAGRLVADGRLTVKVTAADAVANGASRSTGLVVDRTAGKLRWSPTAFFPQDGDRLRPSAAVSFRLTRAARVTLRILDASGREIRRAWSNRSMAAGTPSWRWNGRTASGARAPQGRYVAELTAVSSLGTTVLRRTVVAAAFRTTLSSATPAAGSRLSVTFRSVEALAARPTATFRQAGRSAVKMTVVRLADGRWRASVVVAAGAPGPATVTLRGRDTSGGRNTMKLAVRVP